jgi:hypothetical protein
MTPSIVGTTYYTTLYNRFKDSLATCLLAETGGAGGWPDLTGRPRAAPGLPYCGDVAIFVASLPPLHGWRFHSSSTAMG